MAERTELEGLPGVFELGWLMLMKPVSLYGRLKDLGVDQEASFEELWRPVNFNRRSKDLDFKYDASPEELRRRKILSRIYVARIATLILVTTVVLTVTLIVIIKNTKIGDVFSSVDIIVTVAFGLGAGIIMRIIFRTVWIEIPCAFAINGSFWKSSVIGLSGPTFSSFTAIITAALAILLIVTTVLRVFLRIGVPVKEDRTYGTEVSYF